MGTGYTNGILNGDIKSFKQFATQCIRAFGGAIHMRDDAWNAEYRPDVVDDYYIKQANEYKTKIKKLQKMSDKEILVSKRKELTEDRDRYLKYINERKENFKKLQEYLDQAKQYEPPTPEHEGIKEFMIQQLTDTIKWDSDTSYFENELKNINEELEHIDPIQIRKTMIQMYQEDIERSEKRYKEEEERINNRNEWARQYLESLNNYK